MYGYGMWRSVRCFTRVETIVAASSVEDVQRPSCRVSARCLSRLEFIPVCVPQIKGKHYWPVVGGGPEDGTQIPAVLGVWRGESIVT
jgi:hypothetical protein